MGPSEREFARLPILDDGLTDVLFPGGRQCYNQLLGHHHQGMGFLVYSPHQTIRTDLSQGFGYSALKAQLFTAPNYATQVNHHVPER